MASKTLLTLLAIAMVFSLATAFYEDEDDDFDLAGFDEEIEKRDNDAYEDFFEMDKKSYPRCRHWLTKALCRCNYKFGKYDENRYNCMSRQRGYNRSPFG